MKMERLSWQEKRNLTLLVFLLSLGLAKCASQNFSTERDELWLNNGPIPEAPELTRQDNVEVRSQDSVVLRFGDGIGDLP